MCESSINIKTLLMSAVSPPLLHLTHLPLSLLRFISLFFLLFRTVTLAFLMLLPPSLPPFPHPFCLSQSELRPVATGSPAAGKNSPALHFGTHSIRTVVFFAFTCPFVFRISPPLLYFFSFIPSPSIRHLFLILTPSCSPLLFPLMFLWLTN